MQGEIKKISSLVFLFVLIFICFSSFKAFKKKSNLLFRVFLIVGISWAVYESFINLQFESSVNNVGYYLNLGVIIVGIISILKFLLM